MAGVKGKSGGARPGAGRKPKAATVITPELAKTTSGDPLDPRPTLEMVAKGLIEVSTAQMKALIALLPYVHAKKGAATTKPETEKPAESRFPVRQRPQLVSTRH